MKPIIYVIDDHPSMRRSLNSFLTVAGYDVHLFSAPAEFLEKCADACSGCIVLDVLMPGMNGLQLQRLLADRDYCMPIIFITGSGDIPMSVKAMKMGAVDFLQKPFKSKTLLDLVEKAVARNRIELARRGENLLAREKLVALTPREKDVMNLVIKGRLNKQIAVDLGIAEKTVKIHRGRVMVKTGSQSVAELLLLVDRAGLRQE